MTTKHPCGWVPYDQRTTQQQCETNEFYDGLLAFDDICSTLSDPPEKVLLHDLEVKATGHLLERIHQVTGSCVGCSAARAYMHAMCGDVVHRGDQEEIKLPFVFATYGTGRAIAGMRGRGEGSWGSAQAKAVAQWGMLPYDSPHVPLPTITAGWAKWTSAIELQWSHPTAWPGDKAAIDAEASKYKMQTVVPIKTPEEAVQLLSQGYGLTMASSFGTRPSVQGDVLIGLWSGSWAHQMGVSGYWRHPQHGLIFAIDNQWGPSAHPACPTLSQLGVRGSFWIVEKDFLSILRSGEVFGHSATNGFPKRVFDWANILSL